MTIEEIKDYLIRKAHETFDDEKRPLAECRRISLSGDEIVALLGYIEFLEVKEVPFDEVRLHGTYRMRNGDQTTITSYDPHEFYCFGGYVNEEFYTFAKNGAWSRHHESQHDLVAEIINPDK